jgi:hypothetical protein
MRLRTGTGMGTAICGAMRNMPTPSSQRSAIEKSERNGLSHAEATTLSEQLLRDGKTATVKHVIGDKRRTAILLDSLLRPRHGRTPPAEQRSADYPVREMPGSARESSPNLPARAPTSLASGNVDL